MGGAGGRRRILNVDRTVAMYSGALRTFHRWYECRVAGSASSAHAAMPSEIGARRDTQPDLSDRRASRCRTPKTAPLE